MISPLTVIRLTIHNKIIEILLQPSLIKTKLMFPDRVSGKNPWGKKTVLRESNKVRERIKITAVGIMTSLSAVKEIEAHALEIKVDVLASLTEEMTGSKTTRA